MFKTLRFVAWRNSRLAQTSNFCATRCPLTCPPPSGTLSPGERVANVMSGVRGFGANFRSRMCRPEGRRYIQTIFAV